MTTNPNVKHIMITATPFSFDNFMNKCRQKGIQPKVESVFLEPGEGYTGIYHMQLQGRIKEPLGPFSTKEKKKFLKQVVDELEQLAEAQGPKYAVVRCTISYQHAWWEEACSLAGFKCTPFNTANKNIADFKERLTEQPSEFEVLLIQRSYKQGKTLSMRHVGAWYENLTSKGRNDADVWQSVGRCCGYHNYPTDFPVYMSSEQAKKAVEYYEKCYLNDIKGAIAMPTSDTATIRKGKVEPERSIFWSDEFKKVQDFCDKLIKKTGMKAKYSTTPSLCSENNSVNVINEFITKKVRQSSEGGVRRLNIRMLDGPSPKYKEYWEDLDPKHYGKYFVVYEKNNVINIKVKKENAVFDPDVKIAQAQGTLF